MRRLLALALLAVLAAVPSWAQMTCVGAGCGRPYGEPVLAPSGSATLPAYSFANDPDTGLLSVSNGVIGVSINTNQRYSFADAIFTIAPGTGSMNIAGDTSIGRNGAGGALRFFSGTAPTCTGNCGTSPSVSGNDTLMEVTIGTSPPAAANFTVTFNGTLSTAPNCVAQRGTTGTTPVVTAVVTTTTTAQVILSANLVASEKWTIWCPGR